MAEFNLAISTVLAHEGGFVNDPNDKGEATNYGISLRYLQSTGQLNKYDFDHDGAITANDIAMLTRDEAIEIYRESWWNKYDYERFVDQQVANKVLDMAVNMGQKQATKLLQRSVNRANDNQHLSCDGVLGPMTMEAVNKIDPIKLIPILKTECAQFYEDLVNARSEFREYFAGWLRRAYAG